MYRITNCVTYLILLVDLVATLQLCAWRRHFRMTNWNSWNRSKSNFSDRLDDDGSSVKAANFYVIL